MKALSIRQPWAWLIANGYKDIENRNWRTKYRGPVLIHASAAKPSLPDFSAALGIMGGLGLLAEMPSRDSFARGGIVGITTITDCVDTSPSPWFFGPQGFILAEGRPLPFLPMKGKLSFFETGVEISPDTYRDLIASNIRRGVGGLS
jgi:hypothetical protein